MPALVNVSCGGMNRMFGKLICRRNCRRSGPNQADHARFDHGQLRLHSMVVRLKNLVRHHRSRADRRLARPGSVQKMDAPEFIRLFTVAGIAHHSCLLFPV